METPVPFISSKLNYAVPQLYRDGVFRGGKEQDLRSLKEKFTIYSLPI